jgi:hypothetical protein
MKNLFKTALMLALLMPATAALAHDFEVDGICYNINDGEATVTYRGHNNVHNGRYTGDVTIPETVTYDGVTYAVTAIGTDAFWQCGNMTSVAIPNSVTEIGYLAFFGCSGLTSITVDSSNPKFDSRDNCNAIIETANNELITGCQNTVIPNSVTAIGNGAFIGCSSLTSVTIPGSVTRIDQQAFAYCNGLTTLTIPDPVTYIGAHAFYECSGLTSVTIPGCVTFIGENAFFKCMNLASIVVASENTTYDSRDNCNALIETESNKLIVGCQNTVIPGTVTAIGNYAFYGCSGLTSVTIPSSVTSIGLMAFVYCENLENIVVASGNPKYDSRDNCNAIIETESNWLIAGCQNTVIPGSVTSVDRWSFAGCRSLTSMIFPSSVTDIGYNAFADCVNLVSVTIPGSVTTIEDDAFYNCNSLNDVYCYILDPSAISMGQGVFYRAPYNAPSRTLHVPQGTSEAYQADDNWRTYFGRIVEDLVPEDCPRGDVNLDGEVNIADVNALLDIILQGSGYSPAADVNGDCEVNIADINAVIDIILGGGAPSQPEHEWVDLGLPSGTLWATCNVGANKPEEYGHYFAWGETEPKDDYQWSTYKWYDYMEFRLTKYCHDDDKTELDLEDDAAYVNWGPSWRMPSLEQINELVNNCTWQRTTVNGVDGMLVTGQNANTMFLPATGYRYYSSLEQAGALGCYWTRTLYTRNPNVANSLDFYSGNVGWGNSDRCSGVTVRAVRVPNN